MKQNDSEILSHQLEEWKYLNEYINRIDLGYSRSILLVSSIFSILVALITEKSGMLNLSVIMVVPPGILAESVIF